MNWNKKALALVLGGLLLVAPVSGDVGRGSVTATLVANFDLDGAATSTTVIVGTTPVLTSNTYTIAAQPDTPRPLTVTLVDADSSLVSCVLTIVGTTADGIVRTSTTNLTGGSGLKVLAPLYNYATLTSVSNGACTVISGGSVDTVSVGTSSTIPANYFAPQGKPLGYNTTLATLNTGATEYSRFDPRVEVRKAVTSGASTTITSVASSGAFQFVAVGTILNFNVGGRMIQRVVTAKASDDSLTVDAALNLGTTGYGFTYMKQFFGPDAEDGWIPVGNFSRIAVITEITQSDSSITTTLQCRVVGAAAVPITVASVVLATALNNVSTVDLNVVGYDQCRAGLQFGTVDTSDAGANLEKINLYFTGSFAR